MGKIVKTISLSQEAIDKVAKLAEKEKRSFSQIIELLILQDK